MSVSKVCHGLGDTLVCNRGSLAFFRLEFLAYFTRLGHVFNILVQVPPKY